MFGQPSNAEPMRHERVSIGVSSVQNQWLWLISLLLLTAWLGARGLNTNPIWYDEWWSIYHAGGAHYGPISLADTWTRVTQEDPRNTPGYYLVLQAWGLLAGWTPLAGRSLSLFTGLLTVAWMYRLGRALISPFAGIGAAVVLGTGTFFTYYLHELRAYTLYALLTAICVWSYWHMIEGKIGWRTQLTFFLCIVGLLYTHYFASLTVAAIGLYHLLLVRKDARWWRIILLMLLAGLTFAPWLKVLSEIIGFFQDTGATAQFALDAPTVVRTTLYMFSNGSAGLLAFFALMGLRTCRHSATLIWFWTLSALLVGLAVNEWLKVILNVRYLMALWPALALLVGLGVDYLCKRGVSLPLVLSIWILSGIWNTFDPASPDEIRDAPYYLPWDTLVEALQSHVQTGDTLIFLLPDQRPLRSSAHEPVAEYYLYGLPIRYALIESPLVAGQSEHDQLVEEQIKDAQRLWVAYDPTKLPDYLDPLDQALRTSHILCGTLVDTLELHLNLYGQLPATSEVMRFGDEITASLLHSITITDGRLNTLITWTVPDNVPQDTYAVALHVEDSKGTLVAQGDYRLPEEEYSCRSSDIDVRGLTQGEYTLLLGVYDNTTGERLPAVNEDTGETGDRLRLGRVTIEGS